MEASTYFGLPIPVGCPVYSNVNDQGSSFGIGHKGMDICFVGSEWTSHEREFLSLPRVFPVTVRNELIASVDRDLNYIQTIFNKRLHHSLKKVTQA